MAIFPQVKRLPASSLVEVTVAAAILVLVFGLALGVCARLVRHGPGPQQLQARQLVQERAAQTIRAQQWQNRTDKVGHILIEQTITPALNRPHLYQLHVVALVQDSVIASHQALVYSPFR
jgi:ABC-type amino acid transport system permease subunit